MQDGSTHRVLVWRTNWLPRWNTFVRDQLAAYGRWQAFSFGMTRIDEPLTEPHRYVFRDGRWAKAVKRRLSDATQERLASWVARTVRPDLLHVHFGTDATRARGVAARLRIPLVVTFHGHDVTVLDDARYVRELDRVLADADLLIAVSGFVAEQLIALGADPAKVHTHHTGIPVRDGVVRAERRAGVLFVGRLVEKKGVADLVTAYAGLDRRLRDEHPLVIVGDGPLEASLRDLCAQLDVAATFTGRLDSGEVSGWFERSAVACVPSKRAADGNSEGLPTVIMEAAAHSTPVIASVHSGNTEAVVDHVTGLLFPEGDVDGLAGALSQLLSDDVARTEMGLQARKMVETEFDIVRQTTKLETLYDEILADRRRTTAG